MVRLNPFGESIWSLAKFYLLQRGVYFVYLTMDGNLQSSQRYSATQLSCEMNDSHFTLRKAMSLFLQC